jgi:hypothetical protein
VPADETRNGKLVVKIVVFLQRFIGHGVTA